MSESKVIDAEFTDVDGTEKGGKRVLEQIADLADHAAKPVEQLPFEGARVAAERFRKVGEVARDVDALVEEAKPLARKAESAIAKFTKAIGLDDFSDRDVLPRR